MANRQEVERTLTELAEGKTRLDGKTRRDLTHFKESVGNSDGKIDDETRILLARLENVLERKKSGKPPKIQDWQRPGYRPTPSRQERPRSAPAVVQNEQATVCGRIRECLQRLLFETK